MADAPESDAPETGTDDTPDPPEPTTEPAKSAGPSTDDPTQLPDDHPLVKAHRAKKDELTKARQKLKEIEDAEKDDLTRLNDDLTSEKERADAAETELARMKAAVKHGLTEDDLDLLGTGTPQEIEARAERLSQRLGDKGRQPTRTLGRTEEPKQDPDAWLRAAAARS